MTHRVQYHQGKTLTQM